MHFICKCNKKKPEFMNIIWNAEFDVIWEF